MLGIVENYKELRKNIGTLIRQSGYKNIFIAEKMGIPAPNFSVKKQRGSWSVEEIEKILAIIENDELEDYYFGEILREKEKDETMSSEEFKKEIGWS